MKGKGIWLGRNVADLETSHITNIIWFIEIFWGGKYMNSTNDTDTTNMFNELEARGEHIGKYRPLQINGEVADLLRKGMVKNNGDIIFKGDVIGSITHIPEWKSYLPKRNNRKYLLI